MIKVLLWTLVLYFLVRFIFNFIVPIARTTRQMKQQMKDFQDKMSGGGQQYGNDIHQKPGYDDLRQKQPKPKAEDYIDFEEVK